MPEIKDKIYELRIHQNLSQNKLAKNIGCSNRLVMLWEEGKCEPSMHYLIKLADFFNVSLDELCCRKFKKVKGGK